MRRKSFCLTCVGWMMCDVEALIAEVRGHLSIANCIGLDESVARQYRKDVPRLIAALEGLVSAPVKGGGKLVDLIAEANSWRDEDPNADSTEQVSEEVTFLIARLTDALEFVTDNYVLKSWSGLFEILDEAYPEDVFLTLPDNESRDSGLRIISLIRLLDRERTRAQVAESRLVSASTSDDMKAGTA